MEGHELIANVLEVAVTLGGALVILCFALAALEALLELVSRVVSRWRDPEPIEYPPLRLIPRKPTMTLLVRRSADSDVLQPTVQLRGGVGPPPDAIRLELVDEDEDLRFCLCRPYKSETLSGDVSLPAFPSPGGASAEEALGWHWDVILENGAEEPYRWREHPHAVQGTNVEAELERPVV